ncbi:MAG: hypothetical protein QG597_3279 [Actinomycetota bacterium]|nr:hypothetical protein [Actinomycetota bacterium]
MSPLHLTWASPASPSGTRPVRALPPAADWHDAALLHATAWMLLGLPVMYTLIAGASYLWNWLYEAVSWFALLAIPAPAVLVLGVGYGLYIRLPHRAWLVHRSRGGRLGRILRRVPPPDDITASGLAR